jgi:hypothetical protein
MGRTRVFMAVAGVAVAAGLAATAGRAAVSRVVDGHVVCSIAASFEFGVPANVLLAVAEQEGGRPGQWVRNTNGTYDVGPLQFNTAYLRDLARYGITPQDVSAPGCYPFRLAAWRLRDHILHASGDFWTRVADYHSFDPRYNAPYRKAIIARASWWARWLDERFGTVDVATEANGGRP